MAASRRAGSSRRGAVDRLTGWREVLQGAGLPDDAVEIGDFAVAGGAAAMERILAAHPDVDGLFVASDLMAEGALRVLAAHGRDVPRDVSVVGFDNLATAASTVPPLTTVQNPMVEMVRGATDLLLDLVGGRGDEIASQVLSPALVERDSV
ncbi:hypothetical protein M768_07760 [Cellulosimicrobium cellulans F16]|uniref:Transcriptional regulator LacI/GalR-like sensor domain-containing protein n=1 Tax=Cellulosimicrobium cellulans F16 TaxID=1350482 RepID=A0A0M0F9F3_CELCE|nr:hypothetical protein M768_07760 [Cellulosimicrobium cellulans F16]